MINNSKINRGALGDKVSTCQLRYVAFVLLLLLITTQLFAETQVHINEAATEETSPNSDWVELYVASGAADLSGWKIYEQLSCVKTFPALNFSYSSGTFIVIHFNSSNKDETNITGDTNENGATDIYTTDSGLTGTSNVITLRDKNGLIVDALVYSDSASWTSTQQSAFNLVVSTGQWTGTINGGASLNFGEAVTVPGGVGEGNSIGRDHFSTDRNAESIAKNDWSYFEKNQTEGRSNPKKETAHPDAANIRAYITEVAPSIPPSQGGDTLKIFFPDKTNLCGMKLYEGTKLIKTFPQVTSQNAPFGSSLLFHAGKKVSATDADETDLTGDANMNGIINLYSDESSPGLSGSVSGNITLKDSNGRIIDFLSWTTPATNTYSSDLQTQFYAAVSTDKWSPSCDFEETDCFLKGSITWFNSSNDSMIRKTGEDNFPLNAIPSPSDWEIKALKPENENGSSLHSQGKLLQIFHSPFSPYGDHPLGIKEALISYTVAEESAVTIHIYDMQGQRVQTILDHARVNGSGGQTAAWDGKDSNSQIVPVGIYIVTIEIEKSNGSMEKDSNTVIVGRKL